MTLIKRIRPGREGEDLQYRVSTEALKRELGPRAPTGVTYAINATDFQQLIETPIEPSYTEIAAGALLGGVLLAGGFMASKEPYVPQTAAFYANLAGSFSIYSLGGVFALTSLAKTGFGQSITDSHFEKTEAMAKRIVPHLVSLDLAHSLTPEKFTGEQTVSITGKDADGVLRKHTIHYEPRRVIPGSSVESEELEKPYGLLTHTWEDDFDHGVRARVVGSCASLRDAVKRGLPYEQGALAYAATRLINRVDPRARPRGF